MSEHVGTALEQSDIDGFLKDHGLGVLSLADADQAYAIPIAFAYDGEQNRCFFRFIMGEDSRKRDFVATTDRASLAVYEWKTQNQWTSVVMNGPIRPVAESELTVAASLFSDIGEEAALKTFNRPITEYDTAWYNLEPDEITGRGRRVGAK